MGRPIRYSTTTTSGSYQKGNVAIGTNPIGYSSGWYNSLTPTGGNFVVTEVIDANTPPRFYTPTNDDEWIRLAKQEGATGANTGSVSAVKSWFASQANYDVSNIELPLGMPNIVGDGLVLNLDANINESYPGSGTTWTDLSGVGNNGTLVNGTSYSNGTLVFDGIDDRVNTPISVSNWAVVPFTIMSTFKWDNANTNHAWFELAGAGGTNWGLTHVPRNGSFYFYWISQYGNGGNICYNSAIKANQYLNIAITFNGIGGTNQQTLYDNTKVYINGVLQTNVGGGGAGINNTSTLYVGNTQYPFKGKMQNFQYYNRQLSESEIKQNYYQAPIVTDGLVFAADAGNLVSYESGSTTTYSMTGSISGSLTNGVGYSSDNGGTWVFDGVDDYVAEPYNSLLDLGTQFTICSFIKLANISSTIQPVFGNADIDLGLRTRGFSFYWYKTSNYGIGANTLRFQFGKNEWGWNVYGSNANAIVDTNWHQVVVSSTNLDTNNPTISFYVDGINVGSTFWSASPKAAILYSQNTGSIRIGSVYYPSSPSYDGPYFLTGNISNTQIYNRALSASEVAQNYNAQRSRFGI